MQQQADGSEFVMHTPCEKCGSSDANSLYTDGHTYCFSCETYKQSEEEVQVVELKPTGLLTGRHEPLVKRKLTENTTKFWDYQIGEIHGKTTQIANHKTPDGKTVGQKIRTAGKEFSVRGNLKEAGLYGQWLWRSGGRSVTVVEGELDALSMSQAFDHKWPVVSVKTGAAGAKRDIKKSIQWLEKFDSVVFMFDQDEAGQKAAQECAALLSPKKAKIARLPLKDASEMVQEGKTAELIDAFWTARDFTPAGIVNARDLWDRVSDRTSKKAIPYPFTMLNNKVGGIRKREIVTICAGSGVGKSQICREIAYDLVMNKEVTLGYIALEEGCEHTIHGLQSIYLNKIVHKDMDDVTDEELRESFDATVGSGRVFLHDHHGSTETVEDMLSTLRSLIRGQDCQYIILDHLSIIMSGMEVADERKAIDILMTKLRTLSEETEAAIIAVCHLKRLSGDRGHEEGATTSLSQLRGSAAIGQLSDIVVGLERNQQDDEDPNTTTVRILKNRWSGETGIAGKLRYCKDTGRMSEEKYEDTPF
jgi:twinkle protein